ncbi:MAG: hypothetical protein ACK5MW_08675 [Enterococcus sp.]
MKINSVRRLTITALLTGLGIVIPMVMPKLVIGPASFTLASHVPLMIAMFFSPAMAVAVALGTALGFLLTGLPLIITLRALSHIVFAFIGVYYLQKHPGIVLKNGQFTLLNGRFQLFSLVIALIHSVVEVLVVMAFNFIGNVPASSYEVGAFYFFFVLMGVGGVIHSIIDYNIAFFVAGTLQKQFEIPVFAQAKKAYRQQSQSLQGNEKLA